MEIGAKDAGARVELESEVIVIGSGAGGAVTAAELVARGLSVLLIEEGGHHKTGSFDTRPTASFRRLYRDGGTSVMLGNPHIGYAEGRTVGGSTVVNGGMSWRTPERILRGWAERGLPAIDPQAMAPIFEKIEAKISVAKQSAKSIGPDAHLFKLGADRMGYEVVENLRNQDDCLGSNNCIFGCPNAAKRSTLVTYVPEALAGGADLLTNARVERVLMAGTRAVGVAGLFVDEASRPTGQSFLARARVVVVACGAAQSPALLMRSGLKSPHLGRHLWIHPNAKAVGIFPEPLPGWHGVHQAFQIREFEDEGIIFGHGNVPPGLVALSLEGSGPRTARLMERYNHMLIGAALIEDSHAGRVRLGAGGQPLLTYFVSGQDMRNFVRGVAILADCYLAAGADEVLTPFHGAPPIRDKAGVEKLRRARMDRSRSEIFTVHIMGTCRMGARPSESVTDPYGRLHGADNVFVADASIFPGPIGVNPMVSIMALATRNAEHVARAAEQQRRHDARAWVAPGGRRWTFEGLCRAPLARLEEALRAGRAPAAASLAGFEFRGYNPPLFARLLGIRKFIKGFEKRGERLFGYNLKARQSRFDEPWTPAVDTIEARFGFYEVVPVVIGEADDAYPNAALLDYGRGENPVLEPARLLRDYLVQVHPDEPDLLLGKATVKLGPGRLSTNFFVLERLRIAPSRRPAPVSS